MSVFMGLVVLGLRKFKATSFVNEDPKCITKDIK